MFGEKNSMLSKWAINYADCFLPVPDLPARRRFAPGWESVLSEKAIRSKISSIKWISMALYSLRMPSEPGRSCARSLIFLFCREEVSLGLSSKYPARPCWWNKCLSAALQTWDGSWAMCTIFCQIASCCLYQPDDPWKFWRIHRQASLSILGPLECHTWGDWRRVQWCLEE